MTGRFDGAAVLVTGAASGIGRATAELFASEGANVLAVDFSEAVSMLGTHPHIRPRRMDASSDDDIRDAVADLSSWQGRVDVVVANAGVAGSLAGLLEETAEEWASLLRINLIGPFLAIQHGARAMLACGRPGAIVCTASVAGLRSGAGGAAYSASKAGVINLVQLAAQQLSGTGIRVNAVCPGLIETGMTRPLYDHAREKGREAQIGQVNPLRRGGSAGEVATTIAFLASDHASYINGQALAVDGGLSTSLPFARPPRLGEASF